MAHLLILSDHSDHSMLPALALLSHKVRFIQADPVALMNAPATDVVLLDARKDLVNAKSLASLLKTTGLSCPMILIVSEGGLAGISNEWGADDFMLESAGPAEIDTRIRLSIARSLASDNYGKIQTSGVVIDEASYSAKLHGEPMDLTFKEFELLKFLAQHPGRVFTRDQLLSEVWGYDYFGGTRTVDVHIRRLRAKLGDLEGLISTVRNVGYRFNLVVEDEPSVTGGY
ncbi:MAG: DNA-binding response regulator [Rhodoluna sp.]